MSSVKLILLTIKQPLKRTRNDLSETEDSDEEASKKSPRKPVSSKGKVSASDKDDVAYGN